MRTQEDVIDGLERRIAELEEEKTQLREALKLAMRHVESDATLTYLRNVLGEKV